MKKKGIITVSIIAIMTLVIFPISSAELLNINNHSFIIKEVNNNYQIREIISINNQQITNESFYLFDIPTNAQELQIIIQNKVIDNVLKQDELYKINLSNFNISYQDLSIEIIYYIPLSTMYFIITFRQNTSNININFLDKDVYSNTFQYKDSSIKLKLTKTITSDSLNIYSIILILLLIIIILVTSWYAFIKRKNGKSRNRNYESADLLETEKTFLLNILKEIEKMHRNQKLSDDSYHKLKNYYKNQTVDIMSAIDGINKKELIKK